MQVQNINYSTNNQKPAFGTLKLPESIKLLSSSERIKQMEKAAEGFNVELGLGHNDKQAVFSCVALSGDGNNTLQGFSNVFLRTGKTKSVEIARADNFVYSKQEYPLVSLIKGAIANLQETAKTKGNI